MFLAVSCNDYPQPFNVTSPFAPRPTQFQHQINGLRHDSPQLFGPFTVKEWVRSPYGYYDDCLRWPKPSRWVHPVAAKATYPNVPTLVIDGDLDSLTSPEGAKDTAAHFPNSTFVETANMTHVSALVDFSQCASVIVRRFVRTKDAGDASCASQYHENRLVGRFARTAAGTGWPSGPQRTAQIANATMADVMARWYQSYGHTGVGLLGGHFTTYGGSFTQPHPVVNWQLDGVRWVKDVAVTGTMHWHRRTGKVAGNITVSGPGAERATLRIVWNDLDRHAVATARGVIAGQPVSFTFPSA
jgi:hypothetical protein